MTAPFNIYAVDDDPMIRDILRVILEANYRLELFPSAEACQLRMQERLPDCLLLDIGLPGMNGYEYCQLLKNDERTRQLPITFISSHDTIESRLTGYDVGGDDFIVKPFEPEELLRKVRVAEASVANRHALQERLASADEMSSIALASMDDSGIVLQFMTKLIGWSSEQEVASGMLALLAQFSVEGVVQTHLGKRVHTVRGDSVNSPLEVSVLNHVRTLGRIFEFHNRGVYNYDRITVMINNMPIADPMLCGRIRDNLAIAAQGASARLESLEATEANLKNQEGITDALNTIEKALATIATASLEERYKNSQLIYQFDLDLEHTFVGQGLSDAQENQIGGLVRDFIQKLTGQMDQMEQLQRSLAALSEKLQGLKH